MKSVIFAAVVTVRAITLRMNGPSYRPNKRPGGHVTTTPDAATE